MPEEVAFPSARLPDGQPGAAVVADRCSVQAAPSQ